MASRFFAVCGRVLFASLQLTGKIAGALIVFVFALLVTATKKRESERPDEMETADPEQSDARHREYVALVLDPPRDTRP